LRAISFGGAVVTIRAVLPHLERSSGRLVVIRSAVDSVALSLLSRYVAAKSALDSFESLRAELRGAGSEITVSVVRPGAVDSPFWRHLTHPADVTPPQIPALTSYRPEAVARAAVMCAIDPRPAITVGGSTLLLQAVNAVARPVTEAAFGGRRTCRAPAGDARPGAERALGAVRRRHGGRRAQGPAEPVRRPAPTLADLAAATARTASRVGLIAARAALAPAAPCTPSWMDRGAGDEEVADRRLGASEARRGAEDELLVDLRGALVDAAAE
jgi:hypothetical protein